MCIRDRGRRPRGRVAFGVRRGGDGPGPPDGVEDGIGTVREGVLWGSIRSAGHGRRVGENANLGTDHGTANTMFMAGKPVIGGHYGKPPTLGTLDETDNLIHTTDFRRVYATAIESWLRSSNSIDILKGNFKPFPIFS